MGKIALTALEPPLRETCFAIYLHWPFCRAKCPYCDFNSYVAATKPDLALWESAYFRELEYFARLSEGRRVSSVFFGGGTPSLMPASLVSNLLSKIDTLWGLDEAAEITLEVNPTSFEVAKFESFKAAGINRVSVGVQALNNDVLQFLGREHSAEEGLEAWGIARDLFSHCSFDLIYARPQQYLEDWQKELDMALEQKPDHLCLYQLTIEPNTGFEAAVRTGKWQPLDDDRAAGLFDYTRLRLKKAGLPAYEVSNHARKGRESRHNLTYWRYQDYIGVGPGAHGRLTTQEGKYATSQRRVPQAWLELCKTQGHGTEDFARLSSKDQKLEALLMGLRLSEGVLYDGFASVLDEKRLDQLIQSGDMQLEEGRLKVTEGSFVKLNAILAWIVT